MFLNSNGKQESNEKTVFHHMKKSLSHSNALAKRDLDLNYGLNQGAKIFPNGSIYDLQD